MDTNLIYLYIKELNDALSEGGTEETEKKIKKLVKLESRFVKRLQAIPGGKQKYRDFINYLINEGKRDLREARGYFRERLGMFKDVINPAIRDNKPKVFYTMKMNYMFCSYIMKNLANPDEKLGLIFQDIKEVREQLVHQHLHLALNKAKSFNRNFNGAIEFSDLIQAANEALIVSVDKYVPEETSPPFQSVAIGRITASLIAYGDQVLPVTLGPMYSRKLYQIRKLLEKNPGINSKQISEIIDIAEEEAALLMNVPSFRSLDESLNRNDPEDSPTITLLDFLPDSSNIYSQMSPLMIVELKDLVSTAAEIFKTLSIMEQKALRLKGINFEGYC